SFASGFPETRLAVDITGTLDGAGLVVGSVAVRNQRAGAFNTGLVPLTSLDGSYVLREGGVDLTRARAVLGNAGSVSGPAHIGVQASTADLVVRALDMKGLYASLHATRLSGKARMELK